MSQDDPVVIVSSSPEFPSIHQLLAKSPKKGLRSGSNAAPIPHNAQSTFTTAASIWQSLHGGRRFQPDTDQSKTTDEPVPESPATEQLPEFDVNRDEAEKGQRKKQSTATNTKTKKASTLDSVDVVPEELSIEPVAAEIAPAPKSRRKTKPKDPDDGQTTIPKGKVTKVAKARAPKKKAETVSTHFANPTSTKPVANTVDDEPIVLEQATRRRMDWTPPPDDTVPPPRADSTTITDVLSAALASSELSQPLRTDLFKNMVEAYNCEMEDEQINGPGAAVQIGNDVLGKRKLIELVAATKSKTATPETSPTKSKAPKKKPRTITELATAAYLTVADSDVSTPTENLRQDSVLDYFDPENDPENDQAENAKTGTGGKAKSSKKAAKPKASKKKAEPRKQVLLSPASALKQVSVQDFVFGTASQLATEDDPDLLRALHEAMKASNQPESDPFASSPVYSELASRRKVGNKLWTAGARDDDGDLLDLEPLDLTESPSVHQDYPLPQIPTTKPSQPLRPSQPKKIPIEILSSELDSFDLSETPSSLKPNSKSLFFSTQLDEKGQPKSTVPKLPPLQKTVEVIPNTLVIDLDLEPPPSNQEHNQLIAQSQSHLSPSKPTPTVPPRPKYDLFTDARLAKEIASYGFKPVKKREAMITLLNQCWENKHKTAGNTMPQDATSTSSAGRAPNAASGPATTHSPIRARGRPRKGSVVAALPASKPASVSSVGSPSRPRGRPRKNSVIPTKSPTRVGKARGSSAKLTEAANTAPPVASTPKRRKAALPSQPIVEIADSGESDLEDLFLSSPMSSPEKQQLFSSSPRQPMDVSITEDTEDASIMMTTSPTSQQASLFRHISEAITTAPRATNPAEPSWHEKILMYDPVILEDLAAWLNAGQLDRVGFDGEVAPHDVKLWCHSQSVCCLWRVNLHGKARKRF